MIWDLRMKMQILAMRDRRGQTDCYSQNNLSKKGKGLVNLIDQGSYVLIIRFKSVIYLSFKW